MLEREYAYYKTHLQNLLNEYEGKFIVIVGETVEGSYPDRISALNEAVKRFRMGTFLIQEVVADQEQLVHRFMSHVYV